MRDKCTCNIKVEVDEYGYFNADEEPWNDLCEYCAWGLEEALAQEGLMEAEAVGSAIQGGLSPSDAKLYVAQKR